MAKKKSTARRQKIRQKKQDKRRRPRRRGREGGLLEPSEALQVMATRPECQSLLPAEPLRDELERLNRWIDSVAGLEEGLESVPGPLSLGLFKSQVLERVAGQGAPAELESTLAEVERKAPHLRLGAEVLRRMACDDSNSLASPFWDILAGWAVLNPALDPVLRRRANLLYAEEPGPEELPEVPTALFLEHLEEQLDFELDPLRERLHEKLRKVGFKLSECYDLLRFFGKLHHLREGMTERELVSLKCRGLLQWARDTVSSRLAEELSQGLGESCSPVLLLAFFGDQLRVKDILGSCLGEFLIDPDGPDAPLNLSLDLQEADPQEAYELVSWVTQRYPDVFDAHLRLGELALHLGREEDAASHAQRALEEVARQPREALEDAARREFEKEAEELLALARGVATATDRM